MRSTTTAFWVIGFLAIGSLRAFGAQGSYQVTIAPGYELVAYCYNTNTLSNAILNPPDNTYVLFWDAQAQNWDAHMCYQGTWDSDYTITPGQGFFINNPLPSNHTFTIQGTKLDAPSYTMYFPVSTNKYLIGSAYDLDVGGGSNWLECQPDCSGSNRYTEASYNFHSSVGDTVWFWVASVSNWTSDIVKTTNNAHCSPPIAEWIAPSSGGGYTCLFGAPQLSWFENGSLNSGGHSRAFFLRPAGGTTSWTQQKDGHSCQ